MGKTKIGDVVINWRRVGSGDDIVLVHGLAANHAFWNLQLLLPLARNYSVTTYDLRGHGYSQMTESGYTSKDMARDLAGLMDSLGIERAHLVGHSYGGVIALHCAVMYPERVSSVTLKDTRLRALQPTQRLVDWPDWQQAKAKLSSVGIEIDEFEDEVGVTLLEKLASPQWREKRQQHQRQPLFVPFSGWASGNRSATRWLKLLETTTVRRDIQDIAGLTQDAIATLTMPMLAIYGEHSRCLRTLEALPQVLPGLVTRVIPEVGHFYPLIKPRIAASMLLEFLDGLSGSANDSSGRDAAEPLEIARFPMPAESSSTNTERNQSPAWVERNREAQRKQSLG
jgi:pimeloyl-ACP methyl ester carboxylesterase